MGVWYTRWGEIYSCTRLTDHRSQPDDLDISVISVPGLAHVTGWEPYDLCDIEHASWVSSVIYTCRSCTTSRTADTGSTVDYLDRDMSAVDDLDHDMSVVDDLDHDLSAVDDLDHDLSGVCVIDIRGTDVWQHTLSDKLQT